MLWKRHPVTHAFKLWTAVGLTVLGVLLALWRSAMPRLRVESGTQASGASRQAQMPTLFGTVTSVEKRTIAVTSKQPYDEITVDPQTSIRSVGGDALSAAEIRPGAVLTATGEDLGGRRLRASVIVILENR